MFYAEVGGLVRLSFHPVWKRNVNAKYVFYALKAEAWRNAAMMLVDVQLKIPMPNEATDRLTGAVLGYTDDEIDAYCARYRK
jgi:hypothetical protein